MVFLDVGVPGAVPVRHMADSAQSVKSGPPGITSPEARNILRHRGLNRVLLIVLVLNLIAAAMVLEFERGNPDANIASYRMRCGGR
jgi:hypothetical protein